MTIEIPESSVVINDSERWIADTYALWAEHMGGSWQFIGGYRKNADNGDMLLKMLKQDWDIDSFESGIRRVNLLISKEYHHNPKVDAWDYCRATQLLGLFYVVGFIDRRLLADYSCTVGKIMQEQFRSWKELCASYMRGCEAWYRGNSNSANADEMIKERRELYQKFCKQKDGPYRLPWKMPLTSAASANTDGYYIRWRKKEEAWVRAHYSRAFKQFWLIVAPLVAALLAVLMGLAAYPDGNVNPLHGAISGVLAGLPVLVFVQILMMIFTRRGRLTKAIESALRIVDLDESERELLGLELLEAWADKGSCIEYFDRPPHGQKSPAHLLISEHFFYQAGTRPVIILIRRSDIDYIDWGVERRTTFAKKLSVSTLYTVLFYFRSGRERRLEGGTVADNGMVFFSKTIRDKAFFMMGGRAQQ